jgi:hypothetical protein
MKMYDGFVFVYNGLVEFVNGFLEGINKILGWIEDAVWELFEYDLNLTFDIDDAGLKTMKTAEELAAEAALKQAEEDLAASMTQMEE